MFSMYSTCTYIRTCPSIPMCAIVCVCVLSGIVQYMREQMKPATIELQTASEIQKFITSEYGSVVAFFHEEEDSDLFAAYSEAANLARVGPVKFGFTRSAEAAKSFAMKPNRIVTVLAPKLVHIHVCINIIVDCSE